ncbi:MAG: hypothetical protein HND44_19620 [Chloroflexi bacterium]|nr:hypothetical protein [Ardenticatenaceae bacterium]MBL1130661.1 hypothetical protein [Chloroflexota bacterium]NOG36755.1 hypothetical protein [Chloroflexota bacterium]
MAKKLFKGHFQATYHLAQVINDMVAEPFAYLRDLEAFYSGDNHIDFIKPFPRYKVNPIVKTTNQGKQGGWFDIKLFLRTR